MSPKDGTREFGWAVYYSVIYYANAIIANKDNIKEGSQEDIDQLVGEAYLLRGYMHFLFLLTYMDNLILKREHQRPNPYP